MQNNPNVFDSSDLSPQREFMKSYPPKPDPYGSLYRDIRSNAKNHEIIGVHIVLQKDNANGLWERFHTDPATKYVIGSKREIDSLLICCDTLEIYGEFCLPEVNVGIFARNLIWADNKAAINTSPLDWAVDTPTDTGENGHPGRKAGDIYLGVANVETKGAQPHSSVRLKALGGRGQNPGPGQKGAKGADMSYCTNITHTDVNIAGVETRFYRLIFNPPAVAYSYVWSKQDWFRDGIEMGDKDKIWPEDGKPAISAGKPGEGGDGGVLYTNLTSSAEMFYNQGGSCGKQGRPTDGGLPGCPNYCGRYGKIKLSSHMFYSERKDLHQTTSNTHTSKKGADVLNPPVADRLVGGSPKPILDFPANVWLHPRSLQKVLEYARDLYLSDDHAGTIELLQAYETGLNQEMPSVFYWMEDGASGLWVAAHMEITSMQLHLREHLDYFGNPGGFAPFLSLSGAIRLYEQETLRAFRALMLAEWVDAKKQSIENRAKAIDATVNNLNSDTSAAADEIIEAEKEIQQLRSSLQPVVDGISLLHRRLCLWRDTQMRDIKSNLEAQASVNFLADTAATLCMVIPVGQPVLGLVGSLGSVAAKFSVGSTSGVDALGNVGTSLVETATAMSDKAKAAKAAAVDARTEKTDVELKEDAALASVNKRANGVKGLGEVLSKTSASLAELQVLESEVEAELKKLQASGSDWKEMTDQIRALNERKAVLSRKLAQAGARISTGYSRMTSNANGVYRLRQVRLRDGELSPEATSFVSQMAQRSRFTLHKYLYIMVKAFESTIFSPLKVEWKLDAIIKKIQDIVNSGKGLRETEFDATIADKLQPLLKANLDKVRDELVQHFGRDYFVEESRILVLDAKKRNQTLLASLNDTGKILVDPVEQSLIPPDRHLARLVRIEIDEVVFDSEGPPLSGQHNFTISIQPNPHATMRRNAALYAVNVETPPFFSGNITKNGQLKLTQGQPSESNADLLNFVVGDRSDEVKVKAVMSPLWSHLYISLTNTLPIDQRPRITKLSLNVTYEAATVNKNTVGENDQCVLDVRCGDPNLETTIECSPGDIENRKKGLGGMIRIFAKGTSVDLRASERIGEKVFDYWQLQGSNITGQDRFETPEFSTTMNGNVIAIHRYKLKVANTDP